MKIYTEKDYDYCADKIKRAARGMSQVIVSIVAYGTTVMLEVIVGENKRDYVVVKLLDEQSAIEYSTGLRDALVDDFAYVKNVIITAKKRMDTDVTRVMTKDYAIVKTHRGVPRIRLGKRNRIYLTGDFPGFLGIDAGNYVMVGYNSAEDSFAFHKTTNGPDKSAFRVADRMYLTAAHIFSYWDFDAKFEYPREYTLDMATSDSSVAVFRHAKT